MELRLRNDLTIQGVGEGVATRPRKAPRIATCSVVAERRRGDGGNGRGREGGREGGEGSRGGEQIDD